MQGVFQLINSERLQGGDITFSASGDVLLASGAEYAIQRVLRRLLTQHGSYIQHVAYGAGLARFIGQPGTPEQLQQIKTTLLNQLLQEPRVALTPLPTVTVSATTYSVFGEVRLTLSPETMPRVLAFNYRIP